MNMKSVISWSLLWATLLTQSCKQDTSTSTHADIADTLQPSEHIISNPDAPLELPTTTIYNPITFNTEPFVDTLTIDMDRVRTGPLGTMPKISRSLSALLWYHGYDKEILIKYNPELDSLLNSKNLDQIHYSEIKQKTIKTPAIYPNLKDFAKLRLKDFLQDKPQRVQDSLQTDHEVIIITRNENNKVVTLYYNHWQIELAQYSSPGIWGRVKEYDHKLKKRRWVDRSTPEWVLYTNRNKDIQRFAIRTTKLDSTRTKKDTIYYYASHDKQDSLRKSWAFNASMPYFIPFEQTEKASWVGSHYGRITGEKLSHGCARQTGQIAMELFDRIDGRIVKVVIFNLYDEKKEEK